MKNEQSNYSVVIDIKSTGWASGLWELECVRPSSGSYSSNARVPSGFCSSASSILPHSSGISPNTSYDSSSVLPIQYNYLEIKMSNLIQKQKMDNINNFYEHLDWIKDIYVHRLDEINVFSNTCNQLTADITDLKAQNEDLRVKLEQSESKCRKMMCETKTAFKVQQEEIDFLKSVDEESSRTIENYYKIPRWIRRIFTGE